MRCLGRFIIGAACLAACNIQVAWAAAGPAPLRREAQGPAGLNRVLRENALFFNMLASFSLTAAMAEPFWGLNVKNINVNLITRSALDAQGKQMVRVRVAGAVRNNNNVELNLLDEKGGLVGRGFFGYGSGQLTFFDSSDKVILDGFIDSWGSITLNDLRLPEGQRSLAFGYVDLFTYYPYYLSYGWYDGQKSQIGGGLMIPDLYSGGSNRLPMYWSFEEGFLSEGEPAYGEADYTLASEITGAINSVLFDTSRTAGSFFADPYSLVPEPAGKAYLPRFTDESGIAVTNPSAIENRITYVARHYDGTLVGGEGIENPVTYVFPPGRQFAAYPADIFRSPNQRDRQPVLAPNEVGWLEIYSYDADLQALFLDGDQGGNSLDGNVGAEAGSSSLVFPELRLGEGESTEIELLNLDFENVMARLELLDREGTVLREEAEFFIAGYGMRSFYVGPGSDLLRLDDFNLAASLRVSCNNANSIQSTTCGRLVGVATYRDRFGSLASAYGLTSESAGAVLVGSHVVSGFSGKGSWSTTVKVARLEGGAAPVRIDLYDPKGTSIFSAERNVPPGGEAVFILDESTLPWGSSFTAGYVRIRADSGRVAGNVSLRWTDGDGSLFTVYPLSNYLSGSFHFNQVAQGIAGDIEYWTGIAVMNDIDALVEVTLEVIGPDGVPDRSTRLALEPYQQIAGLLSQFLQEPLYTRLNGYIRLTASQPVSAIVLYGDSRSRFLSAVPGIPR